jgi:hypothetical protein
MTKKKKSKKTITKPANKGIKVYPTREFTKADINAETIRPGRIDNLVISMDYDTNPNKSYPVLLFTPDTENTREHWHIPFTQGQAAKLMNYLADYLGKPDYI